MTARRLPNARPAPDRVAPADWRLSAACAGDWDLYERAMPSHPYGPPIDRHAERDALAICAACPVRAACDAARLPADDPWHVRGGSSPRQRKNAARRETPGPDAHPCQWCGEAFATKQGLAVHVGHMHRDAERPHECRLCAGRFRDQRSLSMHWSKVHAADVGECIRGHEYRADGGRCRECVREHDAARKAQKEAAA